MFECEGNIREPLREALVESVDIRSEEGDCKVTVPFRRTDFDSINFWVKESEGGYIVTDEGQTFGMLYVLNVDLSAPSREKKIHSIKEMYNLDKVEYEIRLQAQKANLGERILDAIHAIQAISYLTYTRRSYSQNQFLELVSSYLKRNEVPHKTNTEISGDAGKHVIDIVLDGSESIYIQTISADSTSNARAKARRTALAWDDIFDKEPSVKKISVVQDEKVSDKEVDRLLYKYSDSYVEWTEKEQLIGAIRG